MTEPKPTYVRVPDLDKELEVHLPAHEAQPAVTHLVDRPTALALNAALAAERPLLLRGEPGTGKSQLARAAAKLLGRRFQLHAVDARTEARDLLYTVDAVSRLAHAQLLGARRTSGARAREALDVMNFVRPGALWWAYNPTSARTHTRAVSPPAEGDRTEGVVLLIDEIDKADPSVPNGLLDAFGSGCFSVEGRLTVHASSPRPLVILTTNEERALPDAFVRRCLVHHLDLPALPADEARFVTTLRARGRANVQNASEHVLTKAAKLIVQARLDPKKHGLCPPGVAEYIDLVRAVTALAEGETAQAELLDEVVALATRKHAAESLG